MSEKLISCDHDGKQYWVSTCAASHREAVRKHAFRKATGRPTEFHPCFACPDIIAALGAAKNEEGKKPVEEKKPSESLCKECKKAPAKREGQCPSCWWRQYRAGKAEKAAKKPPEPETATPEPAQVADPESDLIFPNIKTSIPPNILEYIDRRAAEEFRTRAGQILWIVKESMGTPRRA